jgi:CBS domain-containing membrane protein
MSAVGLVPQHVRPLDRLGDLRARDVMTSDVVTLSPQATVEQALTLMRECRVRHLPVLLDGRFVGLVDDRLVALAHLADGAPVNRAVEALMTHYVPEVSPDADLPRLARLVGDSGCDAVVVVDEAGELLGIVTATDLVGVLATATGVAP